MRFGSVVGPNSNEVLSLLNFHVFIEYNCNSDRVLWGATFERNAGSTIVGPLTDVTRLTEAIGNASTASEGGVPFVATQLPTHAAAVEYFVLRACSYFQVKSELSKSCSGIQTKWMRNSRGDTFVPGHNSALLTLGGWTEQSSNSAPSGINFWLIFMI